MVEWVYESVAPMPPARDEEVRAAEQALGVRFPADYLAVATTHQGVEPMPSDVDLPDGSVVSVHYLLPFADSAGPRAIVARRYPLEDVLDPKIVPFAEDTGGDLFCFDFRADPDRPSVGFWSTDTGFVPLAPDFAAFVAMLHA